MKTVTGGSCAVLLALILMMDGYALNAASCESLSSLALPNTSITLAQMVPAGGFSLPGTGPALPQFSQLPAFCRVAATLTPSSDSDIKIEVWLPAPAVAWNDKFQAVGNGGFFLAPRAPPAPAPSPVHRFRKAETAPVARARHPACREMARCPCR